MVFWEKEENDDRITIELAYKAKGQDWTPLAIPSLDGINTLPNIAYDHNGNFLMVWVNENENLTQVYGSLLSTTTLEWTDPILLSDPAGDDYAFPIIKFYGKGKALISWQRFQKELDKWFIEVIDLNTSE